MRVSISTTAISFAARLATLLALILSAHLAVAGTKTTQPPLKHITINLNDRAALRNGAMFFMQRCMACHSLQGSRFIELAKPLGLSPKQVDKYLNPTSRRVRQTMISDMPKDIAKKFLSKAPPDLTVIAKGRTPDWLYTYLTSFYLDPSRPTGANNVAFYNVAMPDVFAGLQGLQAPVRKEGFRFGSPAKIAVGVKSVTKGSMTPKEFDTMAKDLVTFLYYVAHPHQQERYAIGPWILGLFGLMSIVSFMMYKGYWRRVVHPEGGRWWSYWKRK